MEYFFFNLSLIILLLGTFFILNSKHLIISLLLLILMYLSISISLIFLGYEFLGFMLIIVYIGAIAMLFLFVLMLFNISVLNNSKELTTFQIRNQLVFYTVFFFVIFNTLTPISSSYLISKQILFSNVVQLGALLYSPEYYIYIIIIGIILIFTLITAIYLTATEEFNQFTLYNR